MTNIILFPYRSPPPLKTQPIEAVNSLHNISASTDDSMLTKIWVQEGIAIHKILKEEYFIKLNIVFFRDLSTIQNQGKTSKNIIVFRASLPLDEKAIENIPNFLAAGLISTGSDLVDIHALQKNNIRFFHFPGKNAVAVRDYVVQSLLLLYKKHPNYLHKKVAVVGKGHVGSLVCSFLQQAEIRYSWYDPFLHKSETTPNRVKHLEQLSDCDVFTFHVPLHNHPLYFTQEMLTKKYFFTEKIPLIIQTSRGKIWTQKFYQKALAQKKIWAQDVYPLEPPRSLWLGSLSTPHIAGYSTNGRLLALKLVLENILQFINFEETHNIKKEEIFLSLPQSAAWNLKKESKSFKSQPHSFLERRDNFPWRKELHEYNVQEQEKFLQKFPFLQKNKNKKILQAIFKT